MCVCVCVVTSHPIYSGRQTCGRTSRGHTGRRSHNISPPSFCGTCLNFYREKDLAVSFPRRCRSRISNFVYPRINRSPSIGHNLFVRKHPSSCDCTEFRTHVPTSEGFEITN